MAKASKYILLVILILAVAAIALVGYRYSMKKSAPKTITTATGQATPGSTSVTYTDPSFGNGTQILAPSGKLAAGFSPAIVYPGSTITYSYERDFSTYTQLTTAVSSTDTVANIDSYYLTYFKNSGYTLVNNKVTATPATINFVSMNGKTRAHVQINTDTSGNAVTIILLTQK